MKCKEKAYDLLRKYNGDWGVGCIYCEKNKEWNAFVKMTVIDANELNEVLIGTVFYDVGTVVRCRFNSFLCAGIHFLFV